MKTVSKTIYRSSVTGRLVTQAYAKKHPPTTPEGYVGAGENDAGA